MMKGVMIHWQYNLRRRKKKLPQRFGKESFGKVVIKKKEKKRWWT
jgi:hypothetical protein